MKKKMRGFKIVVLLVVLIFGAIACTSHKPATVKIQAKSDVQYTCPMHPQILEDHPGSCPICRMTLVKKSGQASESSGISLNTVLQPVNSSVISSVNSITPKQKEISVSISANGHLDFDARTFNNIASRFSGRIERLYVKYAFEMIHKGQRIFDVYSPDMVTAQQDLIYVTRNSPQETGLINAARQKLLLLGMTVEQINQVVKTGKAFYSLPVYSPYEGHVHDIAHSQMEGATTSTNANFSTNLPLAVKQGMFVQKGQTLFNVVDPHKLWAVIKIDPSAISAIKLNQPVKITLPDAPEKIINGKVNFIEPVLENGDKTTSIRVYVNNMKHDLKVNSLVKAEIQTGTKGGLWILRSAVVDLGRTRIVWLKQGSLFLAHEICTGIVNGNEIQVIKGLVQTDSLASNAQYLTDSESFIKTKGNE